MFGINRLDVVKLTSCSLQSNWIMLDQINSLEIFVLFPKQKQQLTGWFTKYITFGFDKQKKFQLTELFPKKNTKHKVIGRNENVTVHKNRMKRIPS